MSSPVVIVDAANVVGSVPDGWWRDRRGAAERLRDALAPVAAAGLPEVPGPVDLLLVVEGAARGIGSRSPVEVVSAAGSGDDEIVSQVDSATSAGRAVWVVTADRGLRERVVRLGAHVLGPKAVPRTSS